jgi:NAD(P)-dependent dehydrogenase (short-subunit alcohol dehydrogenase family)
MIDNSLVVRQITAMGSPAAIVTGAGRGLGAAIAESLALAGVQVVLAGRTATQLAATAQRIATAGGTALSVPTDVTDADSVQALFDSCLERFGQLDVLVNNAGVTGQTSLTELDEVEWQRIFDTNVHGMFLCSRAAARHFSGIGAGRAINVASVFGLLGRPGFSAYCASKGAVINFTRSVAGEWAKFGAQMNAVAPGYFATDINADLRQDAATVAKVLRRIPARRMGEPAELANVVTYLALNAPDFLTGQIIAVDGGESST